MLHQGKLGDEKKNPLKRWFLWNPFVILRDPYGLPWWLHSKESTCWCKRHRFDSWSGNIPQATEHVNPGATTPEPVPWSPGAATLEPTCLRCWRAWSSAQPRDRAPQLERPPQQRARAPQLERTPQQEAHAPQLERRCAATRTQHSRK